MVAWRYVRRMLDFKHFSNLTTFISSLLSSLLSNFNCHKLLDLDCQLTMLRQKVMFLRNFRPVKVIVVVEHFYRNSAFAVLITISQVLLVFTEIFRSNCFIANEHKMRHDFSPIYLKISEVIY